MPGRGRRVAARQSQLGQRRRRQNKNVSPTPTLKGADESTETEIITGGEQDITHTDVAIVAPEATNAPSRRMSGRPVSPALAHNYVKAELVKISIMGSVVILALVGLSFLI